MPSAGSPGLSTEKPISLSSWHWTSSLIWVLSAIMLQCFSISYTDFQAKY